MRISIHLNGGEEIEVTVDETQYYYIEQYLRTGNRPIFTNRSGRPSGSLIIPAGSVSYVEVLKK